MGRFGIAEILIIGSIVLLLFGPSKLPELGRSIGETMNNFKKGMKESSEKTDDEEI